MSDSGGGNKKSTGELPPICLPQMEPAKFAAKELKMGSLWEGVPGSDKLIEVTDHNIEQIFVKHNSILIIFYGTWCSVCKDVNIEIAKAATLMSPQEGVLGICDAMDNVKLVDKFLIRKTPSIKYFKNGQYVADYIGKPLAEDIISFMKNPPKQTILLTHPKKLSKERKSYDSEL